MRRQRRGRRRMRKGEEGEERGSTVVQSRQWSGRKYWVTHISIFLLARITHSCENIELDVPKSDCSEPLCGRTQGHEGVVVVAGAESPGFILGKTGRMRLPKEES